MRNILFVCAFVLVLVGSASSAQSVSSEQELAALRAEWAHDLRAKQLEPSVALYTDDAVFLTPDGKRYVGKDEIRALYKGIFADLTSEIVFDSKQTGFSGILAYDSGTYRETLTAVTTGVQQQVTGSYLAVLRREPDGKWRIVQQMWAGTEPTRPSASTSRH
jgi:uncharacterized protein (TIGR02246 family)